MWPGQQPPGGEQNPQQGNNPQQNNPYQQPGYQQPGYPQQPGHPQPNPYQQPGYQQTPYPQQGQGQWNVPTSVDLPQPPSGGGGDGGDGGNRTRLVAIVAATAVVVAAGVTGFLVLGGDKDDSAGGADDKPSRSASKEPSEKPSEEPGGGGDNPRGTETEEPTVPGWKVVVNPRWGIAFDVPADWEVQDPGVNIGFEEADSDDPEPLITMAGVAQFKSKWCTSDENKDGSTEDTALGAVGTKGADGAKDTQEVAVRNVPWWVYGGYTQPDRKSITTDKKAEDFTTASGIKGSIAWAESTNTPQKGKCATDGKALAFGFKNSNNDFVSWNFHGVKGVKDEIPKERLLEILKTVRLHGEPSVG
ncbi:hypothetical protein ACIQNG_04370 [Streptomyces sp. NPDC091377]|uniref:hypothetical protein n=1 Tax=Streptomyces sp. NPDC091377 TaxID=3365995 RepID=UPI00381FE154